MIRTLAILVGKDLALLGRDRTALFWVFLFPVVAAILLGMTIGDRATGLAPLPVQIVDRGNADLARTLAASPALKAVRAACVEAGDAAVRAGKAVAVVVVGPGAASELRADPTRGVEVELLRAVLAGTGGPKTPLIAVAGNHPRAALGAAFSAGMVWVLIGAGASFALLSVRERRSGAFLRLSAAPVSRLDMMLGNAAACWLVCAVALLLLLLLGAASIGTELADGWALAAGLAAAAACFVGLMALLGQCGSGEIPVAASAWGALLVLALFGGAIVPFAMLPEWMQAIGQASPVRWAAVVFEGALWHGKQIGNLAEPLIALASTAIVTLGLGLALFHRRAR